MTAKPLRRRQWPQWTYYPACAFALILIWPMLKVLEWCGIWPRVMTRGMNRMMFAVGPLRLEPNDVVIGSYFKSGTTWTMQTVLQIAHRGRAEFEHIHDLVPWYEIPQKYRFAVSTTDQSVRAGAEHGLRVIKTHLSLDHLEYSPTGLYIWVVRDPKDVLVSSYLFFRSIAMGPLMPSLEKWLDSYLSPDAMLGSWAAHLKSGWDRRHEHNVLFLTYEEMKTDSPNAIQRMSELMRVDLNPEELAEVAKRSSFEYMKALSHKFDTTGLSPPWVRPQGSMVRRGQKGGSAELLSADDQRRIDDHWRSELQRIDCDFPYERVYGAVT